METKTRKERLAELAQEHRALYEQTLPIALQVRELTHENDLEILKESFPDAKVLKRREIGCITPSDSNVSATKCVAFCKQNNVAPTAILVDDVAKKIYVFQ